MEAFEEVETLREAIYGKVALVRHVCTKEPYAIKVMSLSHMLAQRAVSGAKVCEDGNRELQVLRRISGNQVYLYENTNTSDAVVDTMSIHPHWEAIELGPNRMDHIHHHHLLTLHTDFIDYASQTRCLVFDYCPYGELYDQFKPPTAAVSTVRIHHYFQQIATAIRFLHSLNIAHRDVSLENILIDEHGDCRLGDFGLACEEGTNCTGRVGKAFYMAPEVYELSSCTTSYNGLSADMWSLGILLFIMVTGVPPFQVPTELDARFHLIQCSGVSSLLHRWHYKLSSSLLDLLERLLCVSVHDRLSIEEVWTHPWVVNQLHDDQVLHDIAAPLATVEMDENDKANANMNQHVRRGRKRMRINTEQDDDDRIGRVLYSMRGPHPSPQERMVEGRMFVDGSIKSLIPPRASPIMVWPKVVMKGAVRNLFRSRRELQEDELKETNP